MEQQKNDLSAWVEDGPNGGKILRLQYPMSLHVRDGGSRDWTEVRVDSLPLRRPTAGDLDLLPSDGRHDLKAMRRFAAQLVTDTRIGDAKLAKDLDVVDFFRLVEVAGDFLPKPMSAPTEDSHAGAYPPD